MKIIIVGCGRVGTALCQQLSNEGHDIIAIDTDSKKIEKIVNTYDVLGIAGNGANSDILKQSRVGNADLIIACTSEDELNIICCMVAKKLGVQETIARVRNPEYFNLFKENELGLSLMVNPEYEAAMEVLRIIKFPNAIKAEEFAGGKIKLIEYKIPANSPLSGIRLKEIHDKFGAGVLVCAVKRGENAYIPDGDFELEQNDRIYVTSTPDKMYKFFKNIGDYKSQIKKIMILGGGRMAFYLAKSLEDYSVKVKILEKNFDSCRLLDDALNNSEIIYADGYDQEILEEQGIEECDAMVALDDNDEKNIIISMYAAKKKRIKVITTIKNDNYYSMLEGTGIESIVSPKALTANQIIRYARAERYHRGGDVCTLYRIVNNKAEVSEFLVKKDFSGINVPIKDLKLKKNVLIAGIVRGGNTVTAHGQTMIKEKDKILIVSTVKGINELSDILAQEK